MLNVALCGTTLQPMRKAWDVECSITLDYMTADAAFKWLYTLSVYLALRADS